jgi:hypothetical protein
MRGAHNVKVRATTCYMSLLHNEIWMCDHTTRGRITLSFNCESLPIDALSVCHDCADLVITHALEWPSLTVQWLPVSTTPTLVMSAIQHLVTVTTTCCS